jgi:hypothetical protein
MSTLSFSAGMSRRLPDLLADAAGLVARWYPGYRFVLVGIPPDGDADAEIRIPCPSQAWDTPEGETKVGGPMGLDGLVDALQEYMGGDPSIEWGSFGFKRAGQPATALVVTPRPSALPPVPPTV